MSHKLTVRFKQQEKMREITNNLRASVNDLDDRILLRIFNYLPFADRARIERVCRKWMNLGRVSWCYYSKELEFGTDTGKFPARKMNANTATTMTNSILHYRGQYLEKISFNAAWMFKPAIGIVKIIANLCSRLKDLDLRYVQISPCDLIYLAENCTTLERLSIGHCNKNAPCHEKYFARLIRQNNGLRHLSVACAPWFTGQALNSFRANTLETLSVQMYTRFSFVNLHIYKFERSITELVLKPYFNEDEGLNVIPRFMYLRVLCLHVYTLTNMSFIEQIVNNCCELEKVDLKFNFEDASDKDLMHLMRLSNLKYLAIRGIAKKISRSVFDTNPVPLLETLVIPYNKYFREDDYNCIANFFPLLEFYRICECPGGCEENNNHNRRCRKYKF